MKNNILKVLMIGITLIIIIILIVLIVILNNDIQNSTNYEGGDEIISLDSKVERVDNNTIFYTIQSCINKYLSYCNVEELPIDGSYLDEAIDGDDVLEYAYSLLDKKYIDEKNITIENIKEHIETYNEETIFKARAMNLLTGKYIKMYGVYGNILDSNNKILKDACFIVNIDELNNSFSICPLEKYSSLDEIPMQMSEDRIERNDNNTYQFIRPTTVELLQDYLEYYKILLNNNIENSYELLDKTYRTVKFPTIEDYKNYINMHNSEIQIASIARYSQTENNEYTQYVCVTSDGKYYVINEKGTMDYNIMLDYYTVDAEEFKTKYKESSLEEKIMMNIDKITQGLNNQDYKYVYSKLADSFKSNYFQTEESFEQYMSNSFYKNNNIEIKNVENQNDNYIFTVEITNANDSSASHIEKTIVVQLKGDMDFVFLFSV